MGWATGDDRGGSLRFRGFGGGTGGRYRAGREVPLAYRVILGAVGATRGRGNVAVKDWFEISPLGAA